MLAHLKSRWLDTEKYPNMTVTETLVTFPMFNLSGQMVGYQTYNPGAPKREVGNPFEQRYWSHTTKPCASKNSELVVWGLETVSWDDRVLFLTEGIFDAARLHWHGLPAVAVMGCNPVHLGGWLKAMPHLKLACVQGDNAGMKLAKYGDRCIYLPEGQDVGSLPEEEFLKTFARWLT